MNKTHILAIDQGTSSTKTILFDENGKPVAKGSEQLTTRYLNNGMVEQDPEDIIRNVMISIEKCLNEFREKGGDLNSIQTVGISNQRETFIVWDKQGKPLYNAVVWQCKRSIPICERWKHAGYETLIKTNTGLLIDPYFSGSKLVWLYENDETVRAAIDAGTAYFGTIDTWLLYRFTHGKAYLTDYTNASRTLLFNLQQLAWDEHLLKTFGLSNLNLPRPWPSASSFGETDLLGMLPAPIAVNAMIGDSHAAAFGEGCFSKGTAKATMGTGCSILMNIGQQPAVSGNGMVTTICWSSEETVQYALEGVIVTCGATIEWLKNELGFISQSQQTEAMATAVEDNGGIYLVPAFSGLGAPYWDMNRKASIVGLTFGTKKNHLVRAALESIPYQIKDVIVAMETDTGISLQQLMVDGAISNNQFIIQFLADLLEKPVINIGQTDVSALGAACLAGLKSGVFKDLEHLSSLHADQKITNPTENTRMEQWYQGWQRSL